MSERDSAGRGSTAHLCRLVVDRFSLLDGVRWNSVLRSLARVDEIYPDGLPVLAEEGLKGRFNALQN